MKYSKVIYVSVGIWSFLRGSDVISIVGDDRRMNLGLGRKTLRLSSDLAISWPRFKEKNIYGRHVTL